MKIKSISLRNFLSVGNITQSIRLDQEPFTLVLGDNIDLGGDEAGARNGCGKSAFVSSISYALYGKAVSDIRKENLINNINGKNMLVVIEFERNGLLYRIERGRRPNILRFFVDGREKITTGESEQDESQGDSRETQKEIDSVIGMSHEMFKQIVALNTYNQPFLSLKAQDQREIIEQLLGVTILSNKAEQLKEVIKTIKENLLYENNKIEAIKIANRNIENSILSLQTRSDNWEVGHKQKINRLTRDLKEIDTIDINKELERHRDLEEFNRSESTRSDLMRRKRMLETSISQSQSALDRLNRNSVGEDDCPTCGQSLPADQIEAIKHEHHVELRRITAYLQEQRGDLAEVMKSITELPDIIKPTTHYMKVEQARDHQNRMLRLCQDLEQSSLESNPYIDQIAELRTSALQAIDWTKVNDLSKDKEHHEFLLKLLTNKDSFIRKRIIDQNLTYLNKRLKYYTESVGLPHLVAFQNDLSVQISHVGHDLDFDNLSRGERNRLILSLSWSFRDVWESLYEPINVNFIDELLDNGIDSAGADACFTVLKRMSQERDKNTYLITHKMELMNKVSNILKATKEDGFTTYSTEDSI